MARAGSLPAARGQHRGGRETMRRRLTLAAIAVAATFAAAPAARASFAFVDEGHDGHLLIVLWETGPAQDVTIDPSVPGNPALTADAPGAQRVDITDTA